MKIRANHAAALTKVEVLIVIVVLAGLAGLLSVSYRDWKKSSDLAQCQGNLKQIILGFQMWISESESNAPPWLIPAPEGTAKFIASGETFRHFQIASNEFGSPKILVCPADKERRAAANWSNFSNTNLSYFANMTAGWVLDTNIHMIGGKPWYPCERPYDMVLTGDRHITGGIITNNMLTLGATSLAGWLAAGNTRRIGQLWLLDGRRAILDHKPATGRIAAKAGH